MTLNTFMARVIFLILVIASIGALAIELVFYFVMIPTWQDILLMLRVPALDSLAITALYILLIMLYVRPVLRFLDLKERMNGLDRQQAEKLLERAVNLPYFMAFLGIFSFSLGGSVIVFRSLSALGWPASWIYYGIISGMISGLLAVPMYIFPGQWLINPLIKMIMESAPGLEPAHRAGMRLNARRKLFLIVGCLVVASAAYTAVVGYSQTYSVLDNMEKMENTILTPEQRGRLLDTAQVKHASDPGIKSARYYRERMGELPLFYASLVMVAVGIALVLAYFAAQGITTPLGILANTAQRLGQGRYQEPIRLITNDEFSEVGAILNRMMNTIMGQLREMASMMETMRTGIRRMDETANTVLAVSAEQSSGATEQATAVQETGSIAEEIVATARQISERAKSVDTLAGNTLNASFDGEKTLAEAARGFAAISDQVSAIGVAMTQLETRFQETYKIVEWMEDIAEQTELLSLNAALEAAGAGEEGRRFSVVAQATRRLAQRAAEAANEIRTMIEGIQKATVESTLLAEDGRVKVEKGGTYITAAVSALKTISNLAQSTSSSIREISMSTNQQTTASEQLAGSVGEVQEVARRVEEGAKEIESAIAEMRDFAVELRKTVDNKGDKPPGATSG